MGADREEDSDAPREPLILTGHPAAARDASPFRRPGVPIRRSTVSRSVPVASARPPRARLGRLTFWRLYPQLAALIEEDGDPVGRFTFRPGAASFSSSGAVYQTEPHEDGYQVEHPDGALRGHLERRTVTAPQLWPGPRRLLLRKRWLRSGFSVWAGPRPVGAVRLSAGPMDWIAVDLDFATPVLLKMFVGWFALELLGSHRAASQRDWLDGLRSLWE